MKFPSLELLHLKDMSDDLRHNQELGINNKLKGPPQYCLCQVRGYERSVFATKDLRDLLKESGPFCFTLDIDDSLANCKNF